MRIFIDVGSHFGETIARLPQYHIDLIYSFEPVPGCRDFLNKHYGGRDDIRILPFGLLGRNVALPIYRPGSETASLREDYHAYLNEKCGPPEMCQFVRASEWIIENIPAGNEVFLKLNCEGAECEILEDVLDSEAASRIASYLVAWDSDLIPDLAPRAERLRERMKGLTVHSFRCRRDQTMKEALS